MGAMPAAVGDVAEFLDVDMDELAGPVTFVAADVAGSGPVQTAQSRHAVAGQDPMHGGWVQPEQIGDAGRSPAAQDTHLDDASFGAGRGAARAAPGPAGAVAHPGFAVIAVAVGPAFRRGR
ncbi:hypothetical protein GCM10022255_000290 [Dactylosporangium darangshiense]|uniref:Uncharacterized protein n=1 Tax=Dactylosporangium darangshiense TaxID=579108 RepID=A0ABP8CSV0_9ACTN